MSSVCLSVCRSLCLSACLWRCARLFFLTHVFLNDWLLSNFRWIKLIIVAKRYILQLVQKCLNKWIGNHPGTRFYICILSTSPNPPPPKWKFSLIYYNFMSLSWSRDHSVYVVRTWECFVIEVMTDNTSFAVRSAFSAIVGNLVYHHSCRVGSRSAQWSLVG